MPQSFRTKLLLGILVLLTGVLGLTYFLVRAANERSARMAIDEDLESAASVFQRIFEMRTGQLRLGARLMSDDWAFRQLYGGALGDLDGGGRGTLVSGLENYRLRLPDAEFLLLISMDGELVADTLGGGEGEGIPYQELIRVAEGMEDWTASRLVVLTDGKAAMLVAVPLLLPEPEGWIVVGFLVDDRLARDFQNMTGVEVFFASPDGEGGGMRVHADSAAGAGIADHLPWRAGSDEKQPFEIHAGEDTWIGTWVALSGGGDVGGFLLRSLSQEMAAFRRLEGRLRVLTLFAFLLSGLVAVFLARGITRPVADLSEGVRRIAEGRYDEPVRVRSRDELGRLAEAFNDMSRGLKERDLVRDLLGRNVSPEIASELMRRPASLGGEEREVTVLFTDIRGFTSLSESSTPTAILEFLNSYFAEVTHVIEAHSGIVDKYIGDAVMAVFGAPVASARHAAQAVECAFALRRALAVFNEKLVESGRKPVGTGMGIATGLVVAGVMGSESRHNYTFLGDTVNLAARLQDETKKFGVDAVVAGSTVEASGLGDFFEPLGSLTVRGKTAAVDVFSLRRA